MAVSLESRLNATRSGYEDECVQHRYRVDAYTGGGGFSGPIRKSPSSYWGPAADIYSDTSVSSIVGGAAQPKSYLIPYKREDSVKFNGRVEATTYDNYYGSIVDLKVSYVLREQFKHRDLPGDVEQWLSDCDDVASEWTEYRADIAKRTAVVGWMGVLIDMQSVEVADGDDVVMSKAQAREAGLKPYPVVVYPANILDWRVDRSGQFEWVKIRTSTNEREEWNSDEERVDSWTVWTRQRWDRYEKRGSDRDAEHRGGGEHGLGIVPLAIYRAKRSIDDPVRGSGLDDGVAECARDHLNRKAEYIEHLRGQVFALLVHVTDGAASEDEVNVGIDNALDLSPEATNAHHYIAPPGSVADTYEGRLEAIVREMYRQARVEYARAGGNAQSGLSRAYEFAQTNLALADFAGELARGDAWVMQIVARWYGASDEVVKAIKVDAPKSFGVNDLTIDIQNAFDLISGGVGPTATKMMKMALLKQVLPDLTAEDLATIESEIAEESAQDDADERMREEAERLMREQVAGESAQDPGMDPGNDMGDGDGDGNG